MKIEPIYYWPKWFLEILPQSEQKRIPSNLIRKLNQAQIHLWRALNIYDDFLDDQGKKAELPVANAYLRQFLETFYRLNLPPDFYVLFNKTIASLEKNNRQEVLQSKLKIKNNQIIIPKKLPIISNLIKLSQKSLPLALGPLAILSFLGHSPKDQKMITSLRFFKYALSAKQLSDDACDWFEDLENGLLSSVNILILREARKRRLILDLKQRPEIIFLLFAEKIAPQISQQLKTLLSQARRELAKITPDSKCQLIRQLINPLERAINKSQEFQALLAKKS